MSTPWQWGQAGNRLGSIGSPSASIASTIFSMSRSMASAPAFALA